MQKQEQRETLIERNARLEGIKILNNIFHLHYPNLNITIDHYFNGIKYFYKFLATSEYGNKILKDTENFKLLRKSIAMFFSTAIDGGIYDESGIDIYVTKETLYEKIKRDKDAKISKLAKQDLENEPIQPYLDFYQGAEKELHQDEHYFNKFTNSKRKIYSEYDKDIMWVDIVTHGVAE